MWKASSLRNAAASGDIPALVEKLDSGANTSRRGFWGWGPLHWAAYNSHVECVSVLVGPQGRTSGVCVDAEDWILRTPLHWAAKKGTPQVVKELLDAGAKTMMRDWYEQLPLHIAASRGNLEVVQLLVNDSPGSCYVCDCYKKKPIDIARKARHQDVVRFLNYQQSQQDC